MIHDIRLIAVHDYNPFYNKHISYMSKIKIMATYMYDSYTDMLITRHRV